MRRALILLLAGCGTIGDPGGGGDHLPVSGGGPFAPLPPDPSLTIDAPFALLDPTADLDEPDVLADGERLALWVTALRNGAFEIDRADAPRLGDGFSQPVVALVADQTWEQGAVRGPAVVRGSPWLLFYSAGGAGGAIGWATSPDGRSWQKSPTPALTANGAEEGALLGPPGAVRIGDRVRIYYSAAGSLWAADAPFADVAAGGGSWTRLDGDPETPARDPMVAAVPFGVALTRVFARVADTPAGRPRHDLYFTVTTGLAGVDAVPTYCGFAASFEGVRFQIGPTPILPITLTTRAPTMAPYFGSTVDGALLLYIEQRGVRDAVAAARSP